jgi:hypothetical protein
MSKIISKEEYEKEYKSILAEKARLDEITKNYVFQKDTLSGKFLAFFGL